MMRLDGLRVAVTGGRDYADWRRLYGVLDEVHATRGIRMIAEGGCRRKKGEQQISADGITWEWALIREVPCFTVWAPWKAMGDAAGPWRNGMMLEMVKPQLLVVAPGNVGTANCVRQARALGIEIMEVPRG